VAHQPCPVCNGDLADGELILVCAPCRERLGHPVHMRETGEFRVPTEAFTGGETSGSRPLGGAQACCWCGKTAEQVRKLLGASAVAICDECVSLCADILEAEFGPDWR
jgi:ATP-dependent Clp protease ATP-binding subunit ClpX